MGVDASRCESDGRGWAKATKACNDGIAELFGSAEVDGKIHAHVVAVEARTRWHRAREG